MTNTNAIFVSKLPYTGGLDTIHILGPSYFDRLDRKQLDNITDDLHDTSLTFTFIKGSMPLRNYLFLTHMPHLLKHVRPDALACLVNRYYWLKKFAVHCERCDEKFRLLETQMVSIIETIENDFPNFDWSVIQTIQHHIRHSDNRLERDE